MPHSSRGSDSIASTTSPSPDNRPSKRQVYEKYGCLPLLAFFSHRVLRSGPKLLLYLAAMVVSLFVVTKIMPSGVQETIVKSTGRLWSSPPPVAGSASSQPPNNDHDSFVGGGLRVVVFGENDIGTSKLSPTPGIRFGDNGNTTWTEAFCSEVHCSTYLSYVPELSWPPISYTANNLFEDTMEKVLEDSQGKGPADDYSFLETEYPLRNKVADAAAQVKSFLARPKPHRPPKETIYVFSFGTWDIWSLSAYPYQVADDLVTSAIDGLFETIETLFNESSNPNSVAYSDYFGVNLTAAYIEANGTVAEGNATKHQHQRRLAPATSVPWNSRDFQPFRIVVPTVLDPSILPAWHLNRPELPTLHTKPEEMRTAVKLTQRWNQYMAYSMELWMNRNTADDPESPRNEKQFNAVNISDKKKRDQVDEDYYSEDELWERGDDEDYYEEEVEDDDNDDDATNATIAKFWREGAMLRSTDYILDMMIDSQLKIIGAKDKKGFGTLGKQESFMEVNVPCIPLKATKPKDAPPRLDKSKGEGHDPKKTKKTRFRSKRESNSLPTPRAVAKTPARPPSPDNVCDQPDQHLFYTPHSLGQRGIVELGRFAAGLLLADPSEHEAYDKSVNIPEGFRKPGTWKAFMNP